MRRGCYPDKFLIYSIFGGAIKFCHSQVPTCDPFWGLFSRCHSPVHTQSGWMVAQDTWGRCRSWWWWLWRWLRLRLWLRLWLRLGQ